MNNSGTVCAINVKLSLVDLSRGASKDSVSSDAGIPREDGYLKPSFIRHTLRIGVGANRRH